MRFRSAQDERQTSADRIGSDAVRIRKEFVRASEWQCITEQLKPHPEDVGETKFIELMKKALHVYALQGEYWNMCSETAVRLAIFYFFCIVKRQIYKN